MKKPLERSALQLRNPHGAGSRDCKATLSLAFGGLPKTRHMGWIRKKHRHVYINTVSPEAAAESLRKAISA
jgi:hypothetical protein